MNITLPPQADTALWVIQGLLVVLFLFTGIFKTVEPVAKLANFGPWVATFPAAVVHLIGITEIIGALGLLLPGIFHFTTILNPLVSTNLASIITTIQTPVVADALALIIAGAIATHLQRKEYSQTAFTIVVVLLLLVLVIGRLILPIA